MMSVRRPLLLLALCTAFAGPAGASGFAPQEAGQAGCVSAETCIAALLAQAGSGDHVKELALMTRMTQLRPKDAPPATAQEVRPYSEATGVDDAGTALVGVLQKPQAIHSWLPENRRALALAYLKNRQPADAAKVLRQSLAQMPSYGPYWLDLGRALAAQDNVPDATAALVLAYQWAQRPATLRSTYEAAAQGHGAMAPVFRAALDAIDANAAAKAGVLKGLPPLARPTPGTKPLRATVDLATCDKPVWPRASLRYEETGTITLAYFITADGRIAYADVGTSSGHADLDHAALLGLAECRFTPANVDGKPVDAWLQLQYVWTLE
ncbi:energy transducer TonB [Pseudoduganella buxea]|uniref:TonB C-terminal domain-containing protein n=2 Tax=Pseudoduganella buxea TaxID=1949069 RepID=A0ABQ1LBC1_9BURK|nr:energy transducer TonB [Pseudoduganella buxea]GGC20249.1 hypothetical protein GCM10011572_47010 [Pseudoduganella buxea]